jgi:hypothetical protein
MKKLDRKPKAKHILASYTIDADTAQIGTIMEPVAAGQEEIQIKMSDWER